MIKKALPALLFFAKIRLWQSGKRYHGSRTGLLFLRSTGMNHSNRFPWCLLYRKKGVLCLFFLTLMAASAKGQIVNVENSRIQSDTTGWLGTAGTTFTFTKNVQEILDINATVHLQYNNPKNLYLLLANYKLLRGRNETLSNNMFYHLRYNRRLNKWLRWEAFTQWQQNTVTNIELRALVGTGPRFKVHESSRFKLYLASLAMYEHEKELAPPRTYNDMRSGNYVSFTYQPNSIFSATTTTFYQPLYRDIADYRILNQLTLTVKATRHFSITTNWTYLFDSHPAAGTPKVNYSISNGFQYVF